MTFYKQCHIIGVHGQLYPLDGENHDDVMSKRAFKGAPLFLDV